MKAQYGSADALVGPHSPDAVSVTGLSSENAPTGRSTWSTRARLLRAAGLVSAAVAVGWASTRAGGSSGGVATDTASLKRAEAMSSAEGVKSVDGGVQSFLSLFKRTFASLEPQKDGEWLSSTIGLDQTAAEFWQNGTQYGASSTDADGVYQTSCMDGKSCCAERASMSSLDGSFTFHQFRSWLTPAGDLSPEYWVSYWNDLHGNFSGASDSDYEWDGFMMLLTAFYTPDLTLFVKNMEGSQTPFLARYYTNPIDDVKMYTLFVNDPYTGHVYQLAAGHVDSSYEGLFSTALDESSCEDAVKVDFSVEKLSSWWNGMNGTMDNTQVRC